MPHDEFQPGLRSPGRTPAKRAGLPVQAELGALADPAQAAVLQRFFKTGPGEYGEGDRFLGIRVPQLRQVAREWRDRLDLAGLETLLGSPIHEERLLGLLVLVDQFQRGDPAGRRERYRFYLEHRRHVNNWDLVDVSAPRIVGAWLHPRSRRPLYALARSRSLWDRRIAIVATLYYIARREYADTFALAEGLLGDAEDLMHKATGWMLREVGKRDEPALAGFLDRHAARMPRTMLRYAIERFPEPKRRAYLLARRTEITP